MAFMCLAAISAEDLGSRLLSSGGVSASNGLEHLRILACTCVYLRASRPNQHALET